MGDGPLLVFPQALRNVRNGGGSGLIFVQYTTDGLTACEGITCVIVDIDYGKKIKEYINTTRYIASRILIRPTLLIRSS